MHVSAASFSCLTVPYSSASLPPTPVEHITALLFADDAKVLLDSFDDVPHFKAAMHTFGQASCQRLSLEKTALLEVGNVPNPREGCVDGLRVVHEAKALGVWFHGGTAPASARWDELHEGVLKCYKRLSHVSLSAFGHGFATAAYGVSRLLHAAEYTGMPAGLAADLLATTAALVDRDEPPGGPLPADIHSAAPPRRFSGVRADLVCGHPTSGGLGALPFAQHLVAREAKWALRLLIDGTSKPWSKLA